LDYKYRTSEDEEWLASLLCRFSRLNDACTKDDCPLQVIKLMIDATTSHGALSFTDCTARYNHIQMALRDQDATAFSMPNGIFCYKVMPFSLKNVRAAYQRAMQIIFKDRFHKMTECYVDDLMVKCKKRLDHL